MKLLAIAGAIACPLAVFVVAFILGMGYAVRSETMKTMRQAGLTKDGAKLLKRAGVFINGLVTTTELNGEFGKSWLSPEKTGEANAWLTDYRKVTNSE